MSKLKNSVQRFNNKLDQGKEKNKRRTSKLEEGSVESIQLEEQKENEKNIESSGNYAHHKKKQCIEWSHRRKEIMAEEFPGDEVDKNTPASAGDVNSIPGPGRLHMPQSN